MTLSKLIRLLCQCGLQSRKHVVKLSRKAQESKKTRKQRREGKSERSTYMSGNKRSEIEETNKPVEAQRNERKESLIVCSDKALIYV